MHEQPEGYGHEPYPNQPQGQGPGGYPPQQPQYPGQPGQQPPYGRQPPYGAQQPPAGGGPPWGQPPPGGWGPQDPMGPGGWGPPPGPPRKSNSGPVIAVAAVAAVVLLGGGGAIVWALSDGGSKPSHPVAASTRPTTVPSFSAPTDLPSVPAFPTPTGSPTLDESMFVQAGDCVKVTGKAPHLKMFRVDCAGAPFKVLKRFANTSDQDKCHSVRGYTTVFSSKSEKYSFLSYVICLKRQ